MYDDENQKFIMGDWDDDYENEKRLPPGSAFFYLAPFALALWGVIIWAVLK